MLGTTCNYLSNRMPWARIVLATALLALWTMPAQADTACAAGQVCTVQLTQTNTLPQMAGVQVTVTIDNTGANTVLSFQVTNNPLSLTGVGIITAGWNGTATSTASTNFGGVQAVVVGADRMDGFGTFNVQAFNSSSTGGFGSAITFTLNGLVTNFASNANGNDFAVELFFNGDCHPFVSGPNPSEEHHNNPACVPSAVIPEPATLSLFGSGLLAIGASLRRRFRKA